MFRPAHKPPVPAQPPAPRPNTPEDDKPDWSFFGLLVLVLLTLCGIPTALVIFGAWAIKVIWGL